MIFGSIGAANRCVEFMYRTEPRYKNQLKSLKLVLHTDKDVSDPLRKLDPTASAVLMPPEAFSIAKQYWQHTGDGTSSRRAEFCHNLLKNGLMCPEMDKNAAATSGRPTRGPKRYQRTEFPEATISTEQSKAQNGTEESLESLNFLEERFGRNLNLGLVECAKSAIRKRIAGSLENDNSSDDGIRPSQTISTTRISRLSEDDVYLYPAGMNAIYNAHRALLSCRGELKSVNFGFPYVDTLKILQKFGPGCEFYGHGSAEELDTLEAALRGGHRFLALFCEFPGNPLLRCPDLKRIRKLANEYDFAVVVDETIGTFANINVLPAADIVVSSLTKIFSGDSNVMGGSAVLNPDSKYYMDLKTALEKLYEDTYWPEDVVFMERNSRDFVSRMNRVNSNAEAICEVLMGHPHVKNVYYPKYNPSRRHYDDFRLPQKGYGGLLSVVFHDEKHAELFYDAMGTAKGPSLGTNFTLCSPYVLLAHYGELPWAAKYGVQADLVRVSVGLEDTNELLDTFKKALAATGVSL